MPIVTQGHQVQIMPQYTALDPNRVTFDPAGLANGAMSSIQLFNALAQQKAFQQAQQELAATREGRLGATNAQNLATINLAPRKNVADIALADSSAALAPSQTEVGLQRNAQTLKDISLADSLRPYTDETAMTKAQIEGSLVPLQGDAAYLAAQHNAEVAPIANQTALEKAKIALSSILENGNLDDKQKLAQIRVLEANAGQTEGENAYFAKHGIRPGGGILPAGVQYQRGLETAAAELGITPEQISRLAGTQIGVSILNKLQAAKKEAWRGKLTPQEQLFFNSIFEPVSSSGAMPVPRATDRAESQMPATGSTSPKPSPASKEVKITSQAQFDSLPIGTPIEFNGQKGIKTK